MKRLEQNSLGGVAAKTPVAVYHGDEDHTVPLAGTQAYLKKACAAGTTIFLKIYKGVDHTRISQAAEPDFLAWLADRFAGRCAPRTCP